MKTAKFGINLLLCFIMITANAFAADSDYAYAGVVEDIRSDYLIIEDTEFQISEDVQVFSISGYKSTLDSVSKGSKIGIKLMALGQESWRVLEIYKLSDSKNISDKTGRRALHRATQ